MPEANDFSVTELRNKAKALGLTMSGTKAELIFRLTQNDPTGRWMEDDDAEERQSAHAGGGEEEFRECASNDEDGKRARRRVDREKEIDLARREREIDLARREYEIESDRRERELLRRELELARREIDILRRNEHVTAPVDAPRPRVISGGQDEGAVAPPFSMNMNLKTIAELVSEFDGTPDNFDVWERQIKFMKETYKLADDAAKTLIGMKLRKKAFDWLHSRAEHLTMTFDVLMDEIGRMYRPKQSKIDLRRKFETRIWKKGETFREYAHDKIVMGNRVPIDADDMLNYLIEGIPDRILRNQASMQSFTTRESLIDSFDKITLQGPPSTSTNRNNASASVKSTSDGKGAGSDKSGASGENKKVMPKTCYNCGLRDHVSAACPTKELGRKCFHCGEHGHIASKCTKKNETTKEACSVTHSLNKKYTKTVTILNNDVDALIDTGSDLTLMCKDEYVKIGAPSLQPTEVRFIGIGSPAHEALGEFRTEIVIDGHRFPILIRVVADTISRQRLLIGTDFLEARNFHAKKGMIYIDADDEDLPEILQINILENDNVTTADLSHIEDDDVRQQVIKCIEDYKPDKTTETTVSMRLVLKDDEAVYQKARRLAPSERDIVNAQIDEWKSQGIVRPSSSDYASPVVLVKKKDGSHRLCVDYRQLNRKIVRDRFPLPLIEDQLDRLQSTKIFSTLDLKNGFFHVPMDPASVKYTAFIVPDGQFEFLRVPFGLCNSPSVFQRYVNAIFRDAIRDGTVLTYMDDLIVLSDDYRDGLEKLKTVLLTASKAGLDINWKKCCFLKKRVEFLGYIIEDGTVRPSERKTEGVKRFPEPKNVRQVQAFLGLTGYFRKFVADYSRIARPLSNLLRADVKFVFGDDERNAFETLKTHLSRQPVLNLYRVGAETELHTDASKHGYGAILLQRDVDDGLLHPIYFASGKTTPAEEKYSSYELEVLAIIRALRRFRVYLLGIRFKIVTDCRAFTMTMAKKDLCVRVARWVLLLEEFEYSIEHRPGRSMRHVDALSRNPLPACLTIDETEESLTARLRKAQRDDGDLREKIEQAEEGKINGYVIQGGLLYKDVGDEMRVVVPKSMQLQIIRRAHERGHFGINKTETLVQNDYWIPELRAKTEKIIRNCIPCILAERRQGRREGFLNPIEKGSTPLDTFHVDHLGPLPSTKKSYAHILVVVDAFSKFVWLYGTKSTTSAEVISRLRKQSFIFANPRRIISDRGTAFTSEEFRSYCREEGIEQVLTTTGVPRGNGQVERVNRTLIPLLTKLSAPKSCEWYRYLDDVQRCLNATPHKSIGTTPFRLMFGVDARLKDDPQIKELLNEELITAFDDDREELRRRAQENIQRVQCQNKRNFDNRRKEAFKYREGDIVAIRKTQQGPGSKLTHKFLGPYEIIRCLRNDRYVVRRIGETEGPKQTSSAVDFMKPWTSDDAEDLLQSDEEDEGGGHSRRMPSQDGRV